MRKKWFDKKLFNNHAFKFHAFMLKNVSECFQLLRVIFFRAALNLNRLGAKYLQTLDYKVKKNVNQLKTGFHETEGLYILNFLKRNLSNQQNETSYKLWKN